MKDVALPLHPDPHAWTWTEAELRVIRTYGEACAKAAREQALDEAAALVETANTYGDPIQCWQDGFAESIRALKGKL